VRLPEFRESVDYWEGIPLPLLDYLFGLGIIDRIRSVDRMDAAQIPLMRDTGIPRIGRDIMEHDGVELRSCLKSSMDPIDWVGRAHGSDIHSI